MKTLLAGDLKTDLIDKLELKNHYINDVSTELLQYAYDNINKDKSIKKIKKYINWNIFADEIERGIFEYCIIFVHMNGLPVNMLSDVYTDKLNDICANLNTDNKIINNQTLKPSILNFEVKAYFVAFLAPEQLHPVRWADIIKKRAMKEELETKLNTTDIYTCWRCKSKSHFITQKQLRCCDEPISLILTCTVCYTTCIK